MTRLIDAEPLDIEMIELLRFYDGVAVKDDYWKGMNDTATFIMSRIDAEPTFDAEPVRHGKWKDIRVGIGTCSECGERYGSVDVMHYCPNCGARMDIV